MQLPIRLRFIVRVIFPALILPFAAHAQVLTLTGRVFDMKTQQGVDRAMVQLTKPGQTGFIDQKETDSEGNFAFVEVSPGEYGLNAIKSDYEDAAVRFQATVSGDTVQVGMNMKTPETNSAGVPTAQPPGVAPPNEPVQLVPLASTAQVSTTVLVDQLSNLPVELRDPLRLMFTQTAVSSNAGIDNFVTTATTINGLRGGYNDMTLDGVNIQDNYQRSSGLDYTPNYPFLSQINNFTVISSNASPLYGSGAAHVAFVTPSGTNQLHGSAYFLNTPNPLNANTWINNQQGIANKYKRNQGGVTLGGPLFTSKLHFFVNYEFQRARDNIGGVGGTSPGTPLFTPLARQGVYTYQNASGQNVSANLLSLAGASIDPTIKQFLASMPNINVPPGSDPNLGYFYYNGDYFIDQDNVTGRVDYDLSKHFKLTGTYGWLRRNSDQFQNYLYQGRPSQYVDDPHNFTSIALSFANNGFTNEVRAGGNWTPYNLRNRQSLGQFNFYDYWIDFPVYNAPVLNSAIDTQPGFGHYTRTFNVQDNASKLLGRHTLQFGYQDQLIRVRTYDNNGSQPFYTVGTDDTPLSPAQLPGISYYDYSAANNLLTILEGAVSSVSQTFNLASQNSGYLPTGAVRRYSVDNHSFYFQDQWKTTNRLTLTLGVRYEYYTPVSEQNGLLLSPVYNGNIVQTVLSPGVQYKFGSGGLYNSRWNNWAPNVGLAWALDPKTVFRAAYSMHYVNDDIIAAVQGTLSSNIGTQVVSCLPYPDCLDPSFYVQSRIGSLQHPPAPPPAPTLTAAAFAPSGNGNFGLQSVSAVDPNLRTPYVQEWSAGFQRQVEKFVIEARYVGNHAVGMVREVDFNQPRQSNAYLSDFLAVQRALINHTPVPTNNPLGASVAQDLQNQQYQLPNAVYSGQSADAAYLLAAFTPAPFGFYPPNNYGFYANPYALNGGTVLGNYSSSTYHGLQLDATRRLGSGLSLQASYIFSKVLSDSARTTGSATEFYRDANNPRLDRAPAPFDIRNSFKINLSYTTPFRKSSSSALRVLLGDTNLSFVAIAQSGAPFSVLSGWATVASSYSGGASYNTASLAPGASASQAVQFHMTGYGPGVFTSSAQSAFVYPGPGQPGTLQPRMFYGPSIYNIDAAIQRTFRIKETMPLDLRFEAINLTNRVNWSVSDQSAPPPSGLIFLQNGFAGQGASSAFPPRRVQIIARFRF